MMIKRGGMIFYNTGIVIQDVEKDSIVFSHKSSFSDAEFEIYKSYRGTYKYQSWPLENLNDPVSVKLTSETQKWAIRYDSEDTIYCNPIIPDRQFCLEYLNHCQENGIKTRLLFCQTEINTPVWDSSLPELTFLGYDYSVPCDLYSAIVEDLSCFGEYLAHPFYSDMIHCKEKLNKYKLFDKEEDMNKYIEIRQKTLKMQKHVNNSGNSGVKLDLVDDMYTYIPFRLSEVISGL
jgi:hypothetical protein